MKNLEFYEPSLGYLDIYERAKNYFKKPGVFNKSKHRLRVGIPDEYYFDFDMIINDLLQMKDVIFLYTNIIKEIEKQHPIDFLGFIEKSSGGTIGAIRLAGSISLETWIPNIPIRLVKELPFEKVKIPSRVGKSPRTNKLESLNCTVVLGHCTTGDEALETANIIEKMGGKVTDVIAYTVRTDKLRWEKFNSRGITFHHLYDVSPKELEKLGLKKD